MNGRYEWTPGKGMSFTCAACQRVWTITEDEYNNQCAHCADCALDDLKKQAAEIRERKSREFQAAALELGVKTLFNGVMPMAQKDLDAAMVLGVLALEEESPHSASLRWMQAMYGAPMIFTPKRKVLWKDIGKK